MMNTCALVPSRSSQQSNPHLERPRWHSEGSWLRPPVWPAFLVAISQSHSLRTDLLAAGEKKWQKGKAVVLAVTWGPSQVTGKERSPLDLAIGIRTMGEKSRDEMTVCLCGLCGRRGGRAVSSPSD